MATPAEGFERLLAILDQMEIPYYVGGSVASSAHGIPRTTMDLDLVADLSSEQIDEFSSLLQPDFYADATMMREALARGRSFNLIHYRSAYKSMFFRLAGMSTVDANSRAASSPRSGLWDQTPSNARWQPPRTPFFANSNGIVREVKRRSANGTIFVV